MLIKIKCEKIYLKNNIFDKINENEIHNGYKTLIFSFYIRKRFKLFKKIEIDL